MNTFYSIIFILIATLLGALGAFTIKRTVTGRSLLDAFKNSFLYLGFSLYGLSVVFYVIVLRSNELSFAYPLISTTYIWTTLFSVKYLGEKMNSWKWLGLFGIILGVISIGLGSS